MNIDQRMLGECSFNQLLAVQTPPGGGVLTYLGMVERFRGDDHHFWDFRSDWVYILYLNTIRLTPSVCLYHI